MTSRLPISLLHSLIILAAVFIIYQPSLNYQFVWDDQLYVVNNPAVQSWTYLPAAFTSPATTWSSDPTYTLPAWRPIRNLSYLIDHTLYGLNPTGYHLTNIILHALTAILLLHLIRRLHRLLRPHQPLTTAQSTIILLATLIWALHPVQTEIVAWIKSRDDLLATPLFLAALLLALPRPTSIPPGQTGEASAEKRLRLEATQSSTSLTPLRLCVSALKIPQLLLATLLFIAALLSKDNTILLAGLYPILLFLLFPSRLRVFASKFWLPTTTFIIIAIIFLALRDLTLGRTAQAPHPGDTPLHTILTMLHAHTRYLQLILWPFPPTLQSADYDNYPIITSPKNPQALLGLLSLIIIALPIIITVKNHLRNFAHSHLRTFPPSNPRGEATPPFIIHNSSFIIAAIAAATYGLSMLPYANIIPMMQILAERFLYLPTIGLAIALSPLIYLSAPPRLCVKTIATSDPSSNQVPPGAAGEVQKQSRGLLRHCFSFSFFCFSSRLRVFASKFLILTLILLTLTIALALQTRHRLPVWTNELTLFRANHHANPTSWRPANLHVKALLQANQTTAALQLSRRNLQQFPNDPDIIRTAAITHLISGQTTAGLQLTSRAIQLQPNDPRASNTLQMWTQMQAAQPAHQ